jgi:hypothetical protein
MPLSRGARVSYSPCIEPTETTSGAHIMFSRFAPRALSFAMATLVTATLLGSMNLLAADQHAATRLAQDTTTRSHPVAAGTPCKAAS